MPLRFSPAALLAAACLGTAPASTASAQLLSEWLNPIDGDWSDPLNWSTPDAPNNAGGTTYDVLIAAGGGAPYTVELNNLSVGVDSITLNDAAATLDLFRSDLTVGVIDVVAGSIYTWDSTITGAQVVSTGGSSPVLWEIDRGATTPGTTFDTLQLSTSLTLFSHDVSTEYWIEGALHLDDGVVMRSEVGRMWVRSNTAITTSGQATIELLGGMEQGGGFPIAQVTIASGITIEMLGTESWLEGDFDLHGVVRADGAGVVGEVGGGPFNNYGMIEAVNGAEITLSSIENYGTLHVGAGSELRVASAVFRMHAGSQISGDGDFVLRSGQLMMNGETLDVGEVNLIWESGRLENGTIDSATGTPFVIQIHPFSNDKTLVGMTLATDVHLSGDPFTVLEGLTLLDNAVVRPVAGSNSIQLRFDDAMTVMGSGRFQFGSGFNQFEMRHASGAVVFDTGIFIDALSGSGVIGERHHDWISRGTIAVGTGQSLHFRGNWSNTGTLIIEDDAELVLSGNFATADFGTVINQGGTIVIDGDLDNEGAVFDLLFVPGHVKIDSGTIIGGTVQSSGSSVLDFGRYASFERVVLDAETTNARSLLVGESLTIERDMSITVGQDAGIYTRDRDSDGVSHLLGNSTISMLTNPNPLVGGGVEIRAADNGGLVIGAGITILQDIPDTFFTLDGYPLTNYGTLDFRDGATTISGQWTNHGILRVSDNADVLLRGNYTTADLLSIDFIGGSVRLSGTLNNTGTVLRKDELTAWITVDVPTHQLHLGDGVKIVGGRIETGDGEAFHNVSSLDGVTLAGDVYLADRNAGTILNGLVFDGGTLHVLDNDSALTSGVFTGEGTIQFDTGRFQLPVLQFDSTSDPFGSGITVQAGNANGTVGRNTYVWTNQATLRSFNAGRDLRVEGEVTHTGSAHAEDGGSITFAHLINHGTLLAENGGILRLEDGWTNPIGLINIIDGGILVLESWSATPGTIMLDAGVVRAAFDTDLPGVAALPQMAGSVLEIAGTLDLGGGTLDLDTSTSDLRLDGGTLLDGTVVGVQPLRITNAFSPMSTLDGVTVQTDVELGGGTTYLRNATAFVGSTVSGDGSLMIGSGESIGFDGTSLDSTVVIDRGGTMAVTHGLTLDGVLRSGAGSGAVPRLLLDGPQTIAGEGRVEAATAAGLMVEFTGPLTLGAETTLAATGGALSLQGAGQPLVLNGTVEAATARTVTMSAGHWEHHGTVSLNLFASLSVDAATLQNHGVLDLRFGSVNTNGTDLTHADDGQIVGSGTIDLAGTGTLMQHGTVTSDESSNALLYVVGDLAQQPTASTRIIFHNSHAESLPYIQATGEIALGGELVLVSESLTFVEVGDTQMLLFGGSVSGAFSQVVGQAIDAQYSWHLDYRADRLLAEARLSGDIDHDGVVGVTDLDLLLANWGDATAPGNTLAGDWDGDGLVGAGDLQVVLDHWGNTLPPTEGNIPEPGTLALLVMTGLAMTRRRRHIARV